MNLWCELESSLTLFGAWGSAADAGAHLTVGHVNGKNRKRLACVQ